MPWHFTIHCYSEMPEMPRSFSILLDRWLVLCRRPSQTFSNTKKGYSSNDNPIQPMLN